MFLVIPMSGDLLSQNGKNPCTINRVSPLLWDKAEKKFLLKYFLKQREIHCSTSITRQQGQKQPTINVHGPAG